MMQEMFDMGIFFYIFVSMVLSEAFMALCLPILPHSMNLPVANVIYGNPIFL